MAAAIISWLMARGRAAPDSGCVVVRTTVVTAAKRRGRAQEPSKKAAEGEGRSACWW